MTNYHLLGQTKLAKMAEEYLTCFVRGDPCEQASSSCLVQIISTNPFEISDNSHHIRVRDPSHILEALKKINSNINLLSMKGALIMLKKWHIESQYLPLKNEVKLDVVIEDVEYIDGLGSSELVMDTVSILEIPSLKNKFRRLQKHLQAQEFDSFHPIDEMLEMLDTQNFKESEKIRKADLRLEKPGEAILDGRMDPFLIWSHDQNNAKSSVSKSQTSQISDFEVLSINSQTQNKYNNVKLKSSVPKRPFQSLPVGNNAFALDFNQLSNDPLIQKMQIDEDLDLGLPSINPTVQREEEDEIVIEDRSGDVTEIIDVTQSEERPSFIREFIQKINQEPQVISENEAGDGQEEALSKQQQLKRNFHEMIKSNPAPGLEGLEQETKKLKYQWGPNHKKEQQKFREVLEGRRSFSKASPEADILDLLASSQLLVAEEVEMNKQKQKENVILVEEEQKQEGRMEEEIISPVRRGKDSGERAIEEVNQMIYESRRMSTPTLGPKIAKDSRQDFYNLHPKPNPKPVVAVQKNIQEIKRTREPAVVERMREPLVVERKTAREKERPMSFGKPQEGFNEVREIRSKEEMNKKEKTMNINQINRRINNLDGYVMIGEKENNKSNSTKMSGGYIDLTREDRVNPKEQYARMVHGGTGVNGHGRNNNESSVFSNARRPETGAFMMQKEVKKKVPKTISSPFDPSKTFDMSDFVDLSKKPKKSSTLELPQNKKFTNSNGNKNGNGNGYGQKRNQSIHIL